MTDQQTVGKKQVPEQTYIETHSIKERLRSSTTDWSTLGTVAATIESALYGGNRSGG